ncbi:MAG: hypothetical protein EOP04_17910 [Proteobacteria bacterium]|nr:MAG: hypothetical protein EOP04_17910 [Pseudomonadota bacterium]
MGFIEFRGTYHFENTKFALGLFLNSNYIDTDIVEQNLDYFGLVGEFREDFGPWRILGSLQLGSGTYDSKIKVSSIGNSNLDVKGDSTLVALNVGVNYHWDAIYLGVEYRLLGSHRVTINDQDYKIKSHGHSFLIGTSF